MPVAGLTSSLTSLIGNHGIYAVFGLMAIDAVLPAASELVMVYAGALAAGAFAGQHVDLFGARISSHGWAFVAMALAGTLGYLAGRDRRLGDRLLRRAAAPGAPRALVPPEPAEARSGGALVRPLGRLAVLIGRVTPVIRSFISIPGRGLPDAVAAATSSAP